MFLNYVKKGFSVVPLKNGIPAVKWSQYTERLPTEEEARDWSRQYNEIALVCGRISGVIALDVDRDDKDLGGWSFRKLGTKGYTSFHTYDGQVSRSQDGIELLSDKRLCTLPPSVHREGRICYRWEGGSLLDSELTVCPSVGFREPVRREVVHREYEKIDLGEAGEALDFIDPDCSRDEWIKVGMALRDEYGDVAFGEFDRWSKKGVKYDGKTWVVWKSFDSTGIGIGTLLWMAEQEGWVRFKPEVSEVNGFDVDVDYLLDDKKVLPKPIEGSLLRKFYDWIMDTSIMPQHELAVGAALCIVGTIKGHKVKTETGLRTNILALGMAPSGAGKDHARKCAYKFFDAARMNYLVSGEPASHAGLIGCLSRDGGVKFIAMDEIGKSFQSMMSQNAMTHQRQILDEITKMFSSADSVYAGREYADEKNNPARTIDQPCLSIWGTGVPEDLYDSLVSRQAIDGFLARWLVFISDRVPDDVDTYLGDVPKELIEQAFSIRNYAVGPQFGPQHGYDSKDKINAAVVPFSPEAKQMYLELRNKYKQRIRDREGIASINARVVEHICKVALVACNNTKIEAHDMQWARDVVEYSLSHITGIAENEIVESEWQEKALKVYKAIEELGGRKVSRADITKKTKNFMRAKELQEVLNDLAESGKVSIAKSDGKTKSTYFYSI